MEEKGSGQDKAKYFFIGGLLGAAATLLLAPKSGRETRDFIATKAREGKQFIKDETHEVQETFTERKEKLRSEAMEILNKAKDMTKKEKDIILSAIDAGREAYREERKAQEESSSEEKAET